LGVTLSIDDFGTGYSSLSYLSQFSVHELKIDRSFVMDMATNSKNSSIVQSTISLAQHLGLSCVAEGAEDHATLRILKDDGCTSAQGYAISKPLPEPEFLEFVERYSAPDQQFQRSH
jgi:EAL domain-containing protein (putative c-di-GMP-specific phosphodiesterase class I)